MIVLVDGPDGTGKTGYSEHVARELGWIRLEMGPVDDLSCIEEKSAVFNDALIQLDRQGVNAVVDRGPVSSLVYSQVKDRDPEVSNARKTIEILDPLVVWLDCDVDELIARYTDDVFDDRDMKSVVHAYRDVMMDLANDGVEVKQIDTTSGAYSSIEELIHSEVIEGRVRA